MNKTIRWKQRFKNFSKAFGQLKSAVAPIVTYIDSDGDTNTFAAADYIVDTDSEPGRIVLDYGEVWPSGVLYPSNPIIVEYVCGYGDDGSDVPAGIRHAMKLIISDMYEKRETILVGTIMSHSRIAENLLWPYRLRGLFA